MSDQTDTLREKLVEYADRTTGYIYADEAEVLRESARTLDAFAVRLAEAEAAQASIQALVDEQAEDEALWAIHPTGQQPIAEAYLQQELRRLHDVIERAFVVPPSVSPEDEPESG